MLFISSTFPRNLWWRPLCLEIRLTNWGWLSGEAGMVHNSQGVTVMSFIQEFTMRMGAGLWTGRRWLRLWATCTPPRGLPWWISLSFIQRCRYNCQAPPTTIPNQSCCQRGKAQEFVIWTWVYSLGTSFMNSGWLMDTHWTTYFHSDSHNLSVIMFFLNYPMFFLFLSNFYSLSFLVRGLLHA